MLSYVGWPLIGIIYHIPDFPHFDTVHLFLTLHILDLYFYSVFGALWPFCAGMP